MIYAIIIIFGLYVAYQLYHYNKHLTFKTKRITTKMKVGTYIITGYDNIDIIVSVSQSGEYVKLKRVVCDGVIIPNHNAIETKSIDFLNMNNARQYTGTITSRFVEIRKGMKLVEKHWADHTITIENFSPNVFSSNFSFFVKFESKDSMSYQSKMSCLDIIQKYNVN